MHIRAKRFGSRWLSIASATIIVSGFVTGLAVSPVASAGPGDAFYEPPAGYETSAPGTILKTRPIVAKALRLFPFGVKSWQLLYRTTDASGQPYAAVTTVLMKEGAAKPQSLLSFQMAYDAIARACMPSYTIAAESKPINPGVAGQPNPTTAQELALVAAGLEKGWAVAVPDPGGVDDRFLTPRVMGYTTLDGIRAAQDFDPLGLPGRTTPTAMWGYSGGGVATTWAAELQPRYAPELNLVGAAAGAPVADLAGAISSADGRVSAGLIAIGIASVAKDSAEFNARLDEYVTPRGRSIIDAAAGQCADKTVLANVFMQVGTLLKVPLDQVLADPVLRKEIDARSRGQATPAVPLYMYNAVHDEVSTIGSADALVANYCAHGASVTYLRDEMPELVSNHGIVGATGSGGAFAWLVRAMSTDQPVQPAGCATATVPSTLLSPAGFDALPEFTRNTLLTVIGELSAG